MDSSAASPFPANTTLSLAIRVNDSMLGQQHGSAVSSRARHGAPPSSASYKVQKTSYRCKFCPSTFKCWRALGGHQKAHRDLREALYKPSRQAWSPAPASNWRSSSHAASMDRARFHAQQFIAWRVHYYHPLARSVPASIPWQTRTGGFAAAQLSSSAPAVDGYRGTGDGGHLVLHEVNQEESADGIDLTLKL